MVSDVLLFDCDFDFDYICILLRLCLIAVFQGPVLVIFVVTNLFVLGFSWALI